MELEDAELFVRAAEEDYQQRVADYRLVVWDNEAGGMDTGVVRQARGDVLAAQQVREVALTELDLAQRNDARREEEEAVCPRCGRVVERAFLFDSAARGVEWCAACDASVETGRLARQLEAAGQEEEAP